jgi:L-lactate dehydrogenase complex protein LldF
MSGMKDFKHLSYASSLCGKCSEVCPVKIDIHKMLLLNRRDAVKEGLNSGTESMGWKAWRLGMMKRKMMDMLNGNWKNSILKAFFKKSWGKKRSLPSVSKDSFSKQWTENKVTAD